MKNISNNIALIITEVAVKTYVFMGVIWSKGNEQYKSFQSKVILSSETEHPTAV